MIYRKVKKMQVFDLKAMGAYPYEERDKSILYKAKEFKARIIELRIPRREEELLKGNEAKAYAQHGAGERS